MQAEEVLRFPRWRGQRQSGFYSGNGRIDTKAAREARIAILGARCEGPHGREFGVREGIKAGRCGRLAVSP